MRHCWDTTITEASKCPRSDTRLSVILKEREMKCVTPILYYDPCIFNTIESVTKNMSPDKNNNGYGRYYR